MSEYFWMCGRKQRENEKKNRKNMRNCRPSHRNGSTTDGDNKSLAKFSSRAKYYSYHGIRRGEPTRVRSNELIFQFLSMPNEPCIDLAVHTHTLSNALSFSVPVSLSFGMKCSSSSSMKSFGRGYSCVSFYVAFFFMLFLILSPSLLISVCLPFSFAYTSEMRQNMLKRSASIFHLSAGG